jgi:hypothetical protein
MFTEKACYVVVVYGVSGYQFSGSKYLDYISRIRNTAMIMFRQ